MHPMDVKNLQRTIRFSCWVIVWSVLAASAMCTGQQAPSGELAVQTTSLPKPFLRQQYRFQLQGQGGVNPLKWQVTSGALPPDLALSEDGVLAGVPTKAGEYSFMVTVSDNGKPAHQKNQSFVVLVAAPLLAEWSKLPKIIGPRLEGSIKVANETEQDFDLTMIAEAVSENGRATAVGYQRVTLKKGTQEMEIPFGQNLPAGAYALNVDVVAEVAGTNTIYRARLVPAEKLVVRQGP